MWAMIATSIALAIWGAVVLVVLARNEKRRNPQPKIISQSNHDGIIDRPLSVDDDKA